MGSTHVIFRGAPGDASQQFVGVKDHLDREPRAEWRKRGDNPQHWELVVSHGDTSTSGLPDGTEIPGGVVQTAEVPERIERIALHPAAIARIVHQANQALQAALGEEVGPQWAHAPQWMRESAESGVRLAAQGHGPEAMHQSWMDERLANGWTYGETKDEAAKTHPCLVPYDQLPAEQRAKDHLFLAISRLFTVDDQQPYNAADICPCADQEPVPFSSNANPHPTPEQPAPAEGSARIGEPEVLGDSNGGDATAEPVNGDVVDAEELDAEVVLLRGGEFDGETTSLADVEEPLLEEGAIVSFEVAGVTYKATDEREGDMRVFAHVDAAAEVDPDAAKSEKVADPPY